MSLPNGLYNLRASPAGGLGGLYATAQGPNHIVTVAPHTPPFFERQVVSTRHLHVFWVIKTANATLSILFSGRSKPSMARKAYIPSLEVLLEDIGT